jgi:hypothetical protein
MMRNAMTLLVPTAACALAVSVVFSLSVSARGGTSRQEQPPIPPAADQVPLDPIPVPTALPVPQAELDSAYVFAAQHDEIVRYIPCFCGCEGLKHTSVASCFVSSRGPNGRVVWNKHGAGCRLCIDVVNEAKRLDAEGHSLSDIRERIVTRFYRKRITPTPPVP